ncbi:MAG TPA: ABC transporter permease [Candidatus Limnocylindria bacterium]|nr:ABC transporter permease [Candidatus Limnocylindria bacterium]
MSILRHALRDLGRRKLRHGLTAAGIAIGVAALVLLGALSEKLTRLMLGGRLFASGQISVSGGGSRAVGDLTRGGLIAGEQLRALERVSGVRAVAPIIMFPVAESPGGLPFSLAPVVFGIDMRLLAFNTAVAPLVVRDGRLFPDPARPEVVVGSQVARAYDLGVGSTLTIRGRPFTVVGVLETTFTGPDSFAFMAFPQATQLLLDSEPLVRRMVNVPGSSVLPIATAAAVFWKPGEDPERLAARIRAEMPDLTLITPAEVKAQLDRSLFFLNAVMLGSGLVALLVGTLAVASTMFTAVVERRREIGLKRVIGATRRQVLVQMLLEAALLGLAGAGLGLAGGGAAVSVLNGVTERLGAPVFLITMRLVVAAVLAPVVLAMLAGLWPAWRAARLAPIEAVRWA